MRSKTSFGKKIFILTIHMIISMIILSGTFITPVAAAVTTIKVNPVSQTVTTGSTFTISVLCTPTQSIKSYELNVVFNPSYLKANSITKGNIFNGYSTYFNAGTIDNSAGTIKNIYNVILGTGSVSSSGTFVTISFTAKSTTGTSSINLNNVGVTNSLGYIPIAITNGSIQVALQSSNPPIYESISPANKSTNIPITTSSLSLTIRDPDSDHFDYTIQTSPNVGRVSVTGTHDGTKQCTISGLKYSTTYRWYVNGTDGVNWKRCWYKFTTAPAPSSSLFSFSGINPSNGSGNILISTSTLTVTIKNSKGHPFNYYIRTSPAIGSTSGYNKYNGSKTCTISSLTYSTTYYWSVSCKDVMNGNWVNQSFWFTTESNNPGGNSPGGGGSYPYENETPLLQNTPPNPPARPAGPAYIQAGTSNYYTSVAFDPDNDTFQLRFDWGDGTYSDWTSFVSSNVSVSISHSWMNVSSYNISVIAQDEHGLNSSWSDTFNITISQASPEEAIVEIITSSNNISTNESIHFDASNSYIPSGTIVTYNWEFGDGTTTSAGPTTAYSYTAPGQYEVTLTIIDDQGETYDNNIIVTVASDAEVITQNAMSFLSIIITSGLIGIIIILVLILILLARGTVFLQIGKKYLAYGQKWTKYFGTKLAEMRHRYAKTIKPERKLKVTISPVKENKPINTYTSSSSVRYSLTENFAQDLDHNLLQRIHEKIDRL